VKNPFARKETAGGATFRFATTADDVIISLEGAGSAVAVSKWTSVRADSVSALAEITAAAEDGRVGPDDRPLVIMDDASVRLHPAFIAQMDAVNADILCLPPPTPFALELKPRNRIDQDEFLIETKWLRPGGQRALVRTQGPFLDSDIGLRRVPEPLWSLRREAQRLAQPLERQERFKALAALKEYWPEDARAGIESDGYLQELRVHYAASLSLKLRTLTPDHTEFDPVLFGASAVVASESDGASLDEEVDSILPPAAQRLFAEQRFRREVEARPFYVLRNGEYVVIDPALRPALDVVRKMQDRPESERREFILNPRRVLRDQLGDEQAERIGLDRLFVETEQFSSRVAGVDVWRKPVLPWLTPIGKNQWLPEKFGVRIGDDYFVVPPENVGPVLERVRQASLEQKTSVPVGDLLEPADPEMPKGPVDLPVTVQVIDAFEGLSKLITPPDQEEDGVGEAAAKWDAARGKLFLIVRENFEEVEFAAEGPEPADGRPWQSITLPKRLQTALKPHQVEGLNWLAESATKQRPGALLADDMGLGKTLQAIAFMAWLQDEANAGRIEKAPLLIVAPTGLLGTWRDEIAKHLEMPRLGPLVPAFGSDLKALKEQDTFGARDIDSGRAALRAEAWREAGVVLTTYETLRDYHFSFARTKFGLIVYDEIQKLKNPASQMTRAAKALNAEFILGMTGTPVENRLQDLWSIMDVIAPGLLGSSRDFERRHPADDRQALGALKSTLTDRRGGAPAYMLRRMKRDALEGLPAKHVHVKHLDMPAVQADAYRDVVIRAAAAASSGTVGKGGMLSTLAAMRGVSLHPLDPRYAPSDLDAYAKDSARLSSTLAILDEIAGKNEKALIFVEDLAMQERLAGLIQARFGLQFPPIRINGGVPGPKRQELVHKFQSNRSTFDVMILSPKAGGVGLTLTSANHVIHLSRWWNPAVEDQATDRVFRIGQTRDVHVHLPLAIHPDPAIRESSFDLRLNALIERKRSLTRDLFLPPDANDADLSDLFREVSLADDVPLSDQAPQEPEVLLDEQGQDSLAAEPKPPPHPEPLDIVAESRSTLTLPREVVTSGIRMWRCAAGTERPTKEIVSLFADREITHVTIRDPYALAREGSRSAQATFLADLAAKCRRIEAVTLEYSPEVDGEGDDSFRRRQFGEFFGRVWPGQQTPRVSLSRRPKRSYDDDFHDRSVEFDVRHAGGSIRRHELLIGRGVEALYDRRKECNVTYAPPAA
jgi:hypothetical protein